MLAAGTGLFRVMAAPEPRAVARLRETAKGLGLVWPEAQGLEEFSRGLSGRDAREAAFMLAIRRAGSGAAYAPYAAGVVPWHAAVGATYAHATAPLRRLADRYVVRCALALARGQSVEPAVEAAFARLPKAMAKADARAGQIERAVMDLAEAVLLAGREGQRFTARVIDADGRFAKVQFCELPVVARVAAAGAVAGQVLVLRLDGVDLARRLAQFTVVGGADWP
jgi:exoribonuclease R